MEAFFFFFLSSFQVKTCCSRVKAGGITAASSWWLTISLLNYSPVSPLSPVQSEDRPCKGELPRRAARLRRLNPTLPPFPLLRGTRLISGCLCHGLEMTGARSPSPWQATAQITPLPERANALLMNNKSTLITNCQPNQLALQLSQTARLGTAARHYGARCPVWGSALLLLEPLQLCSSITPFPFKKDTHFLSAVTQGSGKALRPENWLWRVRTDTTRKNSISEKVNHMRVLSTVAWVCYSRSLE